MKHVGILTFHHVHNFGAVLQAWALSHTIQSLGHRGEVIDYRPPEGHTLERRKGLRGLVPSLGKYRMERFVRRKISLSGRSFTDYASLSAHIASAGYDALVCGSDQVWFTINDAQFDPSYFLDFEDVGTAKRISYAPSAGPLSDFGSLTDRIASALQKYDAISVRDVNTATAVGKVDVDQVTRVVDPTMIADFSPLLNSKPKRDFIAVVGKMDAAANEYIRFAARALNLPVVAFGTRCEGADHNRPFASPTEWLRALSGAQLVITSLFHGAAISLSLRTPFVALDCGGRAFKLEDLCGYCHVPERLLTRKDTLPYAQSVDLLKMDYGPINARLDTISDQSRSFLQEAING